jgi:hypothetical protein
MQHGSPLRAAVVVVWALAAAPACGDLWTPVGGGPAGDDAGAADPGQGDHADTPYRGDAGGPPPAPEPAHRKDAWIAPRPEVGADAGADGGRGASDGGAGRDGSTAPSGCGAEATGEACYACCDGRFPDGVGRFNQATRAFRDCTCLLPGRCAEACAGTYCDGVPPARGDACYECLSSAVVCEAVADGICTASEACASLMQCYGASRCSTKP